jgi:hypothetical protein
MTKFENSWSIIREKVWLENSLSQLEGRWRDRSGSVYKASSLKSRLKTVYYPGRLLPVNGHQLGGVLCQIVRSHELKCLVCDVVWIRSKFVIFESVVCTYVRLKELHYSKFSVPGVIQGVSFVVSLNTTVLSRSKPHPRGHPTTAAVMTGATKVPCLWRFNISDFRKRTMYEYIVIIF